MQLVPYVATAEGRDQEPGSKAIKQLHKQVKLTPLLMQATERALKEHAKGVEWRRYEESNRIQGILPPGGIHVSDDDVASIKRLRAELDPLRITDSHVTATDLLSARRSTAA